jgi:hypothetical protein
MGRRLPSFQRCVSVPIAGDDKGNVSKVDDRLVHMQADHHGGPSNSTHAPKACERAMRDEIGPFQIWRIFLALAVTAAVIGVAYLTIAFVAELMK